MSDTAGMIAALRKFGAEATPIEAKRAATALPRSILETLSSFSNTPGGGTIILGLAESGNFAATGVADPQKIMADLSAWAREEIEPPLVPDIEFVDFEGCTLVTAEIPELPKNQKPCYVKKQGVNRGAYIRVGDGDRRLTSEEVNQLIADRGQPVFDQEPVLEAGLDDLDPAEVGRYASRLRTGTNSRIFEKESDETILTMTKVIVNGTDGRMHPTLAGLLSLGRYPQQYFPQLNITFVYYPTNEGTQDGSGLRFLDNASIDGPVPVMVEEALAVVRRNMKQRALIVGSGRKDIWEYPPEALREAVSNAVVHRDLSPGSRGTQVQIEMYPDRLRILNSGGLFGSVDVEHLGDDGTSSARNGTLLKILEDVRIPREDRTVCENRGSGIRTILAALREAGMSPPRFTDRTTSFEVTFPNHTLLDAETLAWLQLLGREGLTETQCVGLAVMKRGDTMTNARYRAATGIRDSSKATKELQDLVARELISQTGLRRGATYALSESSLAAEATGKKARPNRRRQILNLLTTHGELSKTEVSELLGFSPKTAEHWLRLLKHEGSVEQTTPGRGHRDNRYRAISHERLFELLPEDN